jgi:hypothetical protein
MRKKANESHVAQIAVIGASLAGLAATAYFLFGPKSAKRRQHAKAWAIKMKGEVVERLEAAREITQPAYQEIIDTVAKDYAKGKKAGQEEIEAVAKDLKSHWKSISSLAIAAKQAATENATKAVKATKKVTRSIRKA